MTRNGYEQMRQDAGLARVTYLLIPGAATVTCALCAAITPYAAARLGCALAAAAFAAVLAAVIRWQRRHPLD